MKNQYKFVQTVVHKDLHGRTTATTAVQHTYRAAAPMSWDAREVAYLRQNGRRFKSGRYIDGLTPRQVRQLHRMERRQLRRPANARSLRVA